MTARPWTVPRSRCPAACRGRPPAARAAAVRSGAGRRERWQRVRWRRVAAGGGWQVARGEGAACARHENRRGCAQQAPWLYSLPYSARTSPGTSPGTVPRACHACPRPSGPVPQEHVPGTARPWRRACAHVSTAAHLRLLAIDDPRAVAALAACEHKLERAAHFGAQLAVCRERDLYGLEGGHRHPSGVLWVPCARPPRRREVRGGSDGPVAQQAAGG